MCEGEYESLKEIYQISPDFVPRPYAWGRYREPQPEIYFLLAEFRDIGDKVGSASYCEPSFDRILPLS